MSRLPTDLQEKVRELFSDANIRGELFESLEQLWDERINVGAAQLARAIVFLSDGDIEQFRELRRTFMGDPRDVLMTANSRLQKSEYWFSEPFSEMGPLKADLE